MHNINCPGLGVSRPGQSRPGQALVYGAQYATSQQGRDAVAEWAALAKLAAAKMERGQGAAHMLLLTTSSSGYTLVDHIVFLELSNFT